MLLYRKSEAAALSALLLCGATFAYAQRTDAFRRGFETPPQSAKPQVWWHWIDGNVSLEGAKLDLAWMQRVGIGGVHIFSGGGFNEPQAVPARVPFMSAEWQDTFRQSVSIARDAGMEVTIAGSPGWSETGGIWVTPEHAMKKYVWSETQVEGGVPFIDKLAQPPSATGPFLAMKTTRRGAPLVDLTHDVYADSLVVAFPTPDEDAAGPTAEFTSSAGSLDLSPLSQNDLSQPVAVPIGEGEKSIWVQARFTQPQTISAVVLALDGRSEIDIQTSDDGLAFRTLRHIPLDTNLRPSPQQTYAITPTTARIFRVRIATPPPRAGAPGLAAGFGAPASGLKAFNLRALRFILGGRVDRFESKVGFTTDFDFKFNSSPSGATIGVIAQKNVIDLTDRLKADGHLDWTPPAGRWTVLRLGYSLTGQTNGPAEASATGLEVDKLDAAMVREYMETYLAMYDKATAGRLGASGVHYLLTDSWEAGPQNWTPAMKQQFFARRGYDLTPFVPVLTGRIVGSAETSDRFLWDFYLTLKEMLADNHYGVLDQVLHEHGMGYYTEAQGDTPRAIGDGFAMKARSDIPTGEFWFRPFATAPGQPSLKADLEESASVAHLYGKSFAASESLTVAAPRDPWAFSPAMLRPVVDEIFAHGINRILIHESHHQPMANAKPGLEMAFFGEYFNRNDTWAEDAAPWITYLARTSYMLQQGQFVADVAYFYGEEQNLTQIFNREWNTGVPAGYHYDFINAEALSKLLSVKNGRLVTKSGMSYRVLFLPPQVSHLTLPTIQAIRKLVAAGAILIAPKPVAGLGLNSTDAEVRAIADEVWGEENTSAGHAFGKGRVYDGGQLAAVFEHESIAPDVRFAGPEPGTNILTLHRRSHEADVYFLSNQEHHPQTMTVTFRIKGEAPELWHADTGLVEKTTYASTDQGVTVPVALAADESVFVVFRKSTLAALTLPPLTSTIQSTIEGPWTVHFDPALGGPASVIFPQLKSWSESEDKGVKYFSGSATYSKSVQVSAALQASKKRLILDLGSVRDLASVTVNGIKLPTVWHAPFEVDITDAVRAGTNAVDITVTNLWPNRLIGDKVPGAGQFTFAPQSPYDKDSPLLPAGLLGPVHLLTRTQNAHVE